MTSFGHMKHDLVISLTVTSQKPSTHFQSLRNVVSGQSLSELQGTEAALSNKKKRKVIKRWCNIVYKISLKML